MDQPKNDAVAGSLAQFSPGRVLVVGTLDTKGEEILFHSRTGNSGILVGDRAYVGSRAGPKTFLRGQIDGNPGRVRRACGFVPALNQGSG